MTAASLLSELQDQGVALSVHDGKLRVQPKSNVKPEQVDQLRKHKAEIINLLAKKKSTRANGYGCGKCGNRIYHAVAVWIVTELAEDLPWSLEHRVEPQWLCEGCGAVFQWIGGTKGPQNIN